MVSHSEFETALATIGYRFAEELDVNGAVIRGLRHRTGKRRSLPVPKVERIEPEQLLSLLALAGIDLGRFVELLELP